MMGQASSKHGRFPRFEPIKLLYMICLLIPTLVIIKLLIKTLIHSCTFCWLSLLYGYDGICFFFCLLAM